jgi:hypothetical protein
MGNSDRQILQLGASVVVASENGDVVDIDCQMVRGENGRANHVAL